MKLTPRQLMRISDEALSRYLQLTHKHGAALPDTDAFAQAVQGAVISALSSHGDW